MPFDLRSLKKADVSAAPPTVTDERVLVLVKLKDGATRPGYVVPRADISPGLFSAEMHVDALRRLEGDPAVESISLSRAIPNLS